jgi:hypothetical protein
VFVVKMGRFLTICIGKIAFVVETVTIAAVCAGEHVSGSECDSCGHLRWRNFHCFRVEESSGDIYFNVLTMYVP